MEFLKLTTNRTLTTNNISIIGDALTIDVIDETNNIEGGLGSTHATHTFSLSELIATHSQDHGCIALFPKGMDSTEVSPMLALETTQLSLPTKVSSNSQNSILSATPGKHMSGSPYSVINERLASYSYVYILTPTANCSAEDIIIIYRDSPSANVTINGEVPNVSAIESTKIYLDSWMPITINGPHAISEGSQESFSVTAPENAIVYLSSDIGVINRTRVTNGKSFLLNTDGLFVGETITIKAGYKHWHGVTSKTISIV